jgi:hypothetical protein
VTDHDHDWVYSAEAFMTADPIHSAICRLCGDTKEVKRSQLDKEPDQEEWMKTVAKFGGGMKID